MKIAIVSINLQMQSGGTRQTFAFAQRLKQEGHQVVIYAPEVNRDIFIDLQKGLDIRAVPYEKAIAERPKGLFGRIIQKLQKSSGDRKLAEHIAAHMDTDFEVLNYHDFAYEIGFYYKLRNPHVRNIWTMNEPPFSYLPKDSFAEDFASRFYNFLKERRARKFLRATDVAVTLDMWDRDWATARGVNAVIIWSGIDFQKFYMPVKERTQPTKSVNLLTVGNPNRYRRFEDAIEATRILREEGIDARLTVNAKNIWHEDAYCNSLKELLVKYKMEESVRLLFDGVSEAELKDMYSKADIFVHPIYAPPPRNGSTWGLVVFEAMACGLPVLLCHTAGAAEPLTDGVNAILVHPKSPDQIADKIRSLLVDPVAYTHIATAGQEFTRENISWELYTRHVVELFAKK